MRTKFGTGAKFGTRPTCNLAFGKISPALRSLALIFCKSQIQGYLSILLDAAELASPFILFSFQLLDTWLNSQKDNERERAMWCTARILGFTAKMNNFKVSGACPGVWALMPPLVALIPTFIPNFIIYIT